MAHGEGLTVHSMASVTLRDGRNIASLGLPSSHLFMYTWSLVHTVDLCVTRWIGMWGIRAEHERWQQRRDRTYDTFQKVQDMVAAWDPDTEEFNWEDAEPSPRRQ
jgi:hypothetical protein